MGGVREFPGRCRGDGGSVLPGFLHKLANVINLEIGRTISGGGCRRLAREEDFVRRRIKTGVFAQFVFTGIVTGLIVFGGAIPGPGSGRTGASQPPAFQGRPVGARRNARPRSVFRSFQPARRWTGAPAVGIDDGQHRRAVDSRPFRHFIERGDDCLTVAMPLIAMFLCPGHDPQPVPFTFPGRKLAIRLPTTSLRASVPTGYAVIPVLQEQLPCRC